jgi:hypothetical protein
MNKVKQYCYRNFFFYKRPGKTLKFPRGKNPYSLWGREEESLEQIISEEHQQVSKFGSGIESKKVRRRNLFFGLRVWRRLS